jgi:hypothetical protein
VGCSLGSSVGYSGVMGMGSLGSDSSAATGAAGGMGLKTPARHIASLARLRMKLREKFGLGIVRKAIYIMRGDL